MPSRAFNNFNGKRKREVLEMADVFQSLNSGRGPNTKYGLLNGALVLLVASWETYCEDVCQQAADSILEKNKLTFDHLSENLRRHLIRHAVSQFRSNDDPLTQEIAKLPDGGWRQLLADRLEEYMLDFNTPKFSRSRGKNLNALFDHVLGLKISREIEEFLEDDGFCQRLDDLVSLRGEIAHRGAVESERLSSDRLRNCTSSFVEAAAAIEVIVHRQFRERFEFVPWQITKPVKQALRESACNKIN